MLRDIFTTAHPPLLTRRGMCCVRQPSPMEAVAIRFGFVANWGKINLERSFMSHRVLLSALALAVALAVPVQGQAPHGWTHPKTPWGDPDLQGVWPGNVGVPMQRPPAFGERATLTD